jgi:hypothetical protein
MIMHWQATAAARLWQPASRLLNHVQHGQFHTVLLAAAPQMHVMQLSKRSSCSKAQYLAVNQPGWAS